MNTAVLLCGDGVSSSNATGRDEVSFVDDLCRRPEQIASAAGDADRLVLGVCEGEYSLGAVQAEARRVGIDPLGIELIDLVNVDGDVGRFDIALNAKIARAEAFSGSSPANAKISWPQRVNRRELLHGLPHEYRSAPSIDNSICAAESGCRACVDACPQGALSLRELRVDHDRSVCEPCGLCVTTCPTGATGNPATTSTQLRAEITALLDPQVGPSGTRGIVFTCSRGNATEMPPGWHPVTLPCTVMVTPAWLLAPLLMGAGAVAALPCSDTGCPLGHDTRTINALEFSRAFLRTLGEAPDRVSRKPSPDLPQPMLKAELEGPFGPGGAVEVMLALVGDREAAEHVIVDHPGAPTGLVEIHGNACTACTMCAQVCPTGALASADDDDRVTVSFDAALCTACTQCIQMCPELDRGAISLQTRADLTALSRGRTALMEADTIRCESCGGPIAPAPMMARVAKMLGPEQEAVRAMITSRCIDCRGVTS